MLRRSLLTALAGAPALTLFGGCGVETTVADGPDAPSFAAPSRAPDLALVLAAGGPRGFAHVGVLKALHDLDIRPDLIVGASVGSLLGGALAAGLPIARIEALAFDFDFYKLARWSPSDGLQLDGAMIATMVRATPWCAAARATDCPWLPRVAAITPFTVGSRSSNSCR